MQHPFTNDLNNLLAGLLDKSVAVYTRAKTAHQIEQSQQFQTDILITYVKQLGWDNDHIHLFLENTATKIPSVVGTLLEAITKGEMKSVLVEDETGLLRDTTLLTLNTLLQFCQEHQVVVITPQTVYNLSDQRDTAMFRFRCQQATEIARFHARRMLQGKERAALLGLYDGRSTPPGYIVDKRQLMDGKKNPTYKKLIPYEPHARIIHSIFCQYVEFNGDLDKLCKQLPAASLLFPEFEEWVDVLNSSKTTLRKVLEGYALILEHLLHPLQDPNPVFIGTWEYKNQVTSLLCLMGYSGKHKNYLPNIRGRLSRKTSSQSSNEYTKGVVVSLLHQNTANFHKVLTYYELTGHFGSNLFGGGTKVSLLLLG